MKPELVLLGPIYAATMAELESRYTVHKAWLAQNPAAFFATISSRIEVVVTSGGRGMTAAEIAALPRLKLIACFGVGVDAIDLQSARARGIAVTNTPDVLTECVADTTWMLILATVRCAVLNDRFVREGQWLRGAPPLTDKVWGENLGIIGLGRIGRAIARRAEGFGMQVAYHGRSRQEDCSNPFHADVRELARWAKVLVVACPGGSATQNIVNREVLDALGKKGYLINISRGSTVDEPELVEALVEGRLAGAGLDVFADEPHVPEALMTLDNVVLQPHVGSGTHATRNAMGRLVLDNVAAWFAGKPLATPVAQPVMGG
jgi:hydroxypyruvate reductase